MTIAEILADCYASTGQLASPDADITTRYMAWINECHRELLSKKHFRRFRRRLLTCASIADSSYMALPFVCTRIFGIQDTANQYDLRYRDMAWIRKVDPGLTSNSSNPHVYSIYAFNSPVIRQPSAACQLYIDSNGAGTVNAYFRAIRTGNYPVSLGPTAFNGTTEVAVGTNTDIIAVDKFWISATMVGDVWVTEGTAGTVLGTIPAGKTTSRYTVAYLWPEPSAAVTYNVDAEVLTTDLSSSLTTEEPLIPVEFHDIFVARVKMKEFTRREKTTIADEAKDEYFMRLRDMYTYVAQMGGVVDSDPPYPRMSQLGPFFGEGT